MNIKFNNKDELYAFLETNDLMGLDSEYSLSTQKLKKSLDAKEIHINKWWVRTSPLWMCPVCNRNKSQIVKLNKHGDLSGQLHEHHDHMSELLKLVFDSISSERESRIAGIDSLKFIEKISFALSAYENTIICSDCNKADADAKKLVNADKYFSFSPRDISTFIIVKNNAEHSIEKEKALECYLNQENIHIKRKKLAEYIATIAANNEHWYEESKGSSTESVNFYYERYMRAYGLFDICKPPYDELLYKPKHYKSDLSKWRSVNKISNEKPTQGDIEHMINTRGTKWNNLNDDWICPICNRTKEMCILKTKTKVWNFNTVGKLFYDSSAPKWTTTRTICDSCNKICTLLQKEVDIEGSLTYSNHYLISENELRKSILKVYNYNNHDVNNDYVDSILDELTIRLENKLYTCSELAPD